MADETDEEVVEDEMEGEWDDREFVSDISDDDLSDLEGPLVCDQFLIIGSNTVCDLQKYRTMILTEMMGVKRKPALKNRKITKRSAPVESGRHYPPKVCQCRDLKRNLKVRT